MEKLLKAKKFDVLGIVSSLLCIVHCVCAPLFLSAHPVLLAFTDKWEYFDYIFVGLSFVAVYFSTRYALSIKVVCVLWIMYMLFILGIVFEEHPALKYISYLGSAGLAITHIVNIQQQKRKNCQAMAKMNCT